MPEPANLHGTINGDDSSGELTVTWFHLSGDGSGTVTFDNATAMDTVARFTAPGDYVLQLVAYNGELFGSDVVKITVQQGAIQEPVADAGGNRAAYVNDAITLDGSNSFDPDGGELNYDWRITEQPPGQATLSGVDTETPTFEADTEGEYEVTLTVTDDDGLEASDTITITVRPEGENLPPVADAGSDQVATVGDTVTLDGTGSYDPDGGDGLSYDWQLEPPDGSSASLDDPGSSTTSFVPDVPGTYEVTLTVSDGDEEGTDTVTVVVGDDTPPPSGTVSDIIQVNAFETGLNGNGDLREVPSIDPKGILYHDGNLLITDSEIDESPPGIYPDVGANLFQVGLTGTLANQWDLTSSAAGGNNEPTGITYCPDGYFYVTLDTSSGNIYRYDSGFRRVDQVSTSDYTLDPEDITCDPATGRLFVIGGINKDILVYRYDGGFVFERAMDISEPPDTEGVTFDPVSGHLFIVFETTIYEYTTDGTFVGEFDIGGFSPEPERPGGITIGPSSDGLGESFYIADSGNDNGDPNDTAEGVIYEAKIIRGN